MENRLIEFTVVVLASEHNPTILNPDFLLRNQIIREEWDWNVIGQPLTTPALSSVQFDSRVIVTVEPIKLQVTDNSGGEIAANHVCEIVSKYVEVIQHVQYSAVGVNFTTMSPVDNVDKYFVTRFLKDGSWNSGKNQLLESGYRFVYGLDHGRIIYSLDKGRKSDVENPFILSRVNIHRDLNLSKMPTYIQIQEILNNVQSDWDRFLQIQTAILG